MPKPCRGVFFLAGFFLLWPTASALAQQPEAKLDVVHILGLEGIKKKTKGNLTVNSGELRFQAGTAKAGFTTTSVQDVFTNDDTKRLVGGFLGTLAMFAPYGGDRFLSLFRTNIDVLTVKYRDDRGALHGVIFTLPKGMAAKVKERMIAQGAHASIPVEKEQQKPEKKEGEKP